MQTEMKLNHYELFCLTPEEASELLWEKIKKNKPDLKFIEGIVGWCPIDVNVQNEIGYTALIYGAVMGRDKCVELLLNHPGIDVSIKDEKGNTALDLVNKRTKIAKLIKEKMNS